MTPTDKITEEERPAYQAAIDADESGYLGDGKFRSIICFLKHGNLKIHAIWLTNKMTGMSLRWSWQWVQTMSHRQPISEKALLEKIMDWKDS